jgi:UDP-2,3-diacylglucosamine pyrophosphatase LpxH
MADLANILVVSDLHFGEELLPGASTERRRAVELGATAFREFLRYHAVRRLGGRPWRLVIAGDLFDFMSVVIPGSKAQPAKTADERKFGISRTNAAGVERLRRICENHKPLLADMVKFAAAGHRIDIIVGNHDIELLAPEVVAELDRQLRASAQDLSHTSRTADAFSRISVVPWFVYEPGTAWIEHGHVYDEGCSFEFNLAPTDPKDGRIVANADYAAIRYMGTTVPDLDPHGIEEWSFFGYLKYSWNLGLRSFGRILLAYCRFAMALIAARSSHQSFKGRDARRRAHRERLTQVAKQGGVSLDTASKIDRLARTPLTVSWRRLGRMLMFDRWGIISGSLLAIMMLFVFAKLSWALVGTLFVLLGATGLSRWLGKHLVTSQLPMRSVPQRLRKLVDAPVVVFGHTHDPRWQPLRGGGLYVNSGTWLPALRPGLRRSFTHVLVQPRPGMLPLVELRQWREGSSQPFDASADLGAGVTAPGSSALIDWTAIEAETKAVGGG